ncbi:5-(carboxyamino)imidazole ribonucleotide synthase [Segetibacter sp. 3557_3]|uniref:5-(carboxyamino)imidazole ribonucleotide synthase n=1 Tax=Segetibacter sp. 3557_3 TaxID=2547429 RepID=UPI0010586A31|nr:5-(carboxyamino)imidazole ribonucleotide synthase [Segetibacter sp. 3557_3]TDH27428.1 5-(carboxyamino)imidazole ribonucleotide synthase [Segetibacter sp. 3557_3]
MYDNYPDNTNAHPTASDAVAERQPSSEISRPPKVGILGGGQLGRMLLQAAANYPVETFVLENDPLCPAAHLCHHFTNGDIRNFDDVYRFGKGLDAITIEIESVNVEALEKLALEGVKVYPRPAVIKTINNKIIQKQFYQEKGIPSPHFVVTTHLQELNLHSAMLPAVHKVGMGGYDGRGVQVMRTQNDFTKGFDAPSVLEKMVDIKKEIAMMVAMDDHGKTAIYPVVEMVMDPQFNLLDYQVSPARVPETVGWKAEAIALKVVRELNSPGIFAIEMFVDKNDDVWVNETAPRVHNSGHHTIEANFSSQFDMLWRVLLGYPLGNTKAIKPSCMVNVVGADNFEGDVHYEGLAEILKIENAFVHLYGKRKTKPGRKMGHITIMSNETHELPYQANKVKQALKVQSIQVDKGEM